MKKVLLCTIVLLSMASLFFAKAKDKADKKQTAAKMVSIEGLDAQGNVTNVQVPYDAKRVAVLDLAALDILDNLGLGDRIVGTTSLTLDYLAKYDARKNKKYVNLGNIKTADFEKVMESNPDVIFIGGRLATSYDELSKIAPVVYTSIDVVNTGVLEGTKINAQKIASIWGKENEVIEKFKGYDERIASLREKAKGKTCILGMVTSGSCNLLGNSGRLSLIVNEVGFNNIGAGLQKTRGGSRGAQGTQERRVSDKAENGMQSTSPHGEESSFELIAKLNPDYMFIMDRDSAIGANGASLAKDIMNNSIINGTRAYKNGNLVILKNSPCWYTAEGGITSLERMIEDLENSGL